MKNTITTLLFVCAMLQSASAQTPDSSQLAVFNTGRNIMLLRADFGGVLTADLIGDMVMAYDTVMVLKAHTAKDSTGKFPKRYQVERHATKITANLKDKIAVIDFNKNYDVTQMCLNAQRAGAKAVIIIHESNDKKVYKLGKKGLYKDSIRIPCFTIPNKRGGHIQELLPSVVGIKKPVPRIQSYAIPNTPEAFAAEQAIRDSIYKAEQVLYGVTNGFQGKGWAVSPNPASDEVVLHYNFDNIATLNIEIFNEIGQIMKSFELQKVQTGKLNIDVTDWQTGLYNVSLRSGSLKEIKRLIIAR
jgi:Secretion system C-terminal sorting domain/PA domain